MEKKIRKTIYIDEDLDKKIKVKSALSQKNQSEIVNDILKKALEKFLLQE